MRASSSATCSSSRIEPYRNAVVVKSARIAAGAAALDRLAGEGDALGEQAGEQDHAVGVLARRLQRARAAGRPVDGDLARRRLAAWRSSKSQRRWRPSSVSPAHSRRISSTVCVSVSTLASFSPISGSGESPTPMPHTNRPGASRASVRRGVGGDRRVAGDRVGDRGADAQRRRRGQRQRRVHVDLAGVQAGVGQPQVVVAERLDPARQLAERRRVVDALQGHADPHHGTSTLRPRTSRARRRARAVSTSSSG